MMKEVLAILERRTAELEDHPLFAFLADDAIDCRQRLAFAPNVAHFAMTFADLYALVLKVEPAKDQYQELVNAHAREDEEHWRWFVQDLAKLDLDPEIRFSQALRFVWGDASVQTRLLSYQMCRLGFQADSLRKLVLVHCIESVGKVTVKHVARVGQQYVEKTNRKLVYFGKYHHDSESDHTLEEGEVQDSVANIEITRAQFEEFSGLVNESFSYFRGFLDEMLAFAKDPKPLTVHSQG